LYPIRKSESAAEVERPAIYALLPTLLIISEFGDEFGERGALQGVVEIEPSIARGLVRGFCNLVEVHEDDK